MAAATCTSLCVSTPAMISCAALDPVIGSLQDGWLAPVGERTELGRGLLLRLLTCARWPGTPRRET
jgi:hypothetical protein